MPVTMLSAGLLSCGAVLGAAELSVPHHAATGRWLVDPERVVSRNDVLYTSPSPEWWEAMPTGGGDLSAMVRWDGSLHVHLTKSDCWGYQEPPDAPIGSRYFNNVSPGHVRLSLGPGAQAAAERRFRQRLDLYRGRVVVEVGEGDSAARLSVWGHPDRRVLVIEVEDPSRILRPTVELSEWRDTMQVGQAGGEAWAREVQTRPARPHLANAGMDGFYPPGRDPLEGRGTAVVVASPEVAPAACTADGLTATLTLPDDCPPTYRILIAAAVIAEGDPLDRARAELHAAVAEPAADLAAQHERWWRDYWGRSFLRLTSPDRTADWLTAAYHVHLYTLACTNRGPVPAKWDGGAGLMREDQRNWGISEWVQEVRFTFMPLYAANRLEMARGFCDFYSAMAPYLRAQTKTMWDAPGLWVPETVTPWGHAEDLALYADSTAPVLPHLQTWRPEEAPYGRFRRYNPYVAFMFTPGLEVCEHYLTYSRYSGDSAFLRERAYPMVRDVCEFVTSLLREGEDGRYHLGPANALETWWLVRDPSDTLDGLRAILPEFIRLSTEYSADAELRERCRGVLDRLPDSPRGLWHSDGAVDSTVDAYAPAAAKGETLQRVNAENPQLYRVFPFGLSGIGSPDFDVALRTFENRICPVEHGWSMDAIWAARLGLGEEACSLLVQHARKFNRFRYGGWDSNDSNVGPDGLAAAPFLDAAGLSAFALQEILLQSHGGVIRIAPAVCREWTGVFRLRAEGGFLVAADVAEGTVRFAEIESLWGRPCAVANPWPGECVVTSGGKQVLRSRDRAIRFPTTPRAVYRLEDPDQPVGALLTAPSLDAPNNGPGLPGRDSP